MATRPFYLVGHNTNSIEEIETGLAEGLNAFEIDVNKDIDDRLYVAHDPIVAGPHIPPPPSSQRLVPFLTRLRALATSPEGRSVALVIFDCKVTKRVLCDEIVAASRAHLTPPGSALPVIYSVPTLSVADTFFSGVLSGLRPNEGLMVDQEPSASEVSEFFRQRGVERAAYGNGATTILDIGLPTPFLMSQMDVAVATRAFLNLRFVYPWVIRRADTMRELVRTGVNGVMVDAGRGSDLSEVLQEFATRLHKARRDDDPFARDDSTFLIVRTRNIASAGTDATIEFTVHLEDGSKHVRRVDGGFNSRFERASATLVTFWNAAFAPEHVRSLEIKNLGGGNAPSWEVDSITLRKRGAQDRTVDFNRLVESGVTVAKAV